MSEETLPDTLPSAEGASKAASAERFPCNLETVLDVVENEFRLLHRFASSPYIVTYVDGKRKRIPLKDAVKEVSAAAVQQITEWKKVTGQKPVFPGILQQAVQQKEEQL